MQTQKEEGGVTGFYPPQATLTFFWCLFWKAGLTPRDVLVRKWNSANCMKFLPRTLSLSETRQSLTATLAVYRVHNIHPRTHNIHSKNQALIPETTTFIPETTTFILKPQYFLPSSSTIFVQSHCNMHCPTAGQFQYNTSVPSDIQWKGLLKLDIFYPPELRGLFFDLLSNQIPASQIHDEMFAGSIHRKGLQVHTSVQVSVAIQTFQPPNICSMRLLYIQLSSVAWGHFMHNFVVSLWTIKDFYLVSENIQHGGW